MSTSQSLVIYLFDLQVEGCDTQQVRCTAQFAGQKLQTDFVQGQGSFSLCKRFEWCISKQKLRSLEKIGKTHCKLYFEDQLNERLGWIIVDLKQAKLCAQLGKFKARKSKLSGPEAATENHGQARYLYYFMDSSDVPAIDKQIGEKHRMFEHLAQPVHQQRQQNSHLPPQYQIAFVTPPGSPHQLLEYHLARAHNLPPHLAQQQQKEFWTPKQFAQEQSQDRIINLKATASQASIRSQHRSTSMTGAPTQSQQQWELQQESIDTVQQQKSAQDQNQLDVEQEIMHTGVGLNSNQPLEPPIAQQTQYPKRIVASDKELNSDNVAYNNGATDDSDLQPASQASQPRGVQFQQPESSAAHQEQAQDGYSQQQINTQEPISGGVGATVDYPSPETDQVNGDVGAGHATSLMGSGNIYQSSSNYSGHIQQRDVPESRQIPITSQQSAWANSQQVPGHSAAQSAAPGPLRQQQQAQYPSLASLAPQVQQPMQQQYPTHGTHQEPPAYPPPTFPTDAQLQHGIPAMPALPAMPANGQLPVSQFAQQLYGQQDAHGGYQQPLAAPVSGPLQHFFLQFGVESFQANSSFQMSAANVYVRASLPRALLSVMLQGEGQLPGAMNPLQTFPAVQVTRGLHVRFDNGATSCHFNSDPSVLTQALQHIDNRVMIELWHKEQYRQDMLLGVGSVHLDQLLRVQSMRQVANMITRKVYHGQQGEEVSTNETVGTVQVCVSLTHKGPAQQEEQNQSQFFQPLQSQQNMGSMYSNNLVAQTYYPGAAQATELGPNSQAVHQNISTSAYSQVPLNSINNQKVEATPKQCQTDSSLNSHSESQDDGEQYNTPIKTQKKKGKKSGKESKVKVNVKSKSRAKIKAPWVGVQDEANDQKRTSRLKPKVDKGQPSGVNDQSDSENSTYDEGGTPEGPLEPLLVQLQQESQKQTFAYMIAKEQEREEWYAKAKIKYDEMHEKVFQAAREIEKQKNMLVKAEEDLHRQSKQSQKDYKQKEIEQKSIINKLKEDFQRERALDLKKLVVAREEADDATQKLREARKYIEKLEVDLSNAKSKYYQSQGGQHEIEVQRLKEKQQKLEEELLQEQQKSQKGQEQLSYVVQMVAAGQISKLYKFGDSTNVTNSPQQPQNNSIQLQSQDPIDQKDHAVFTPVVPTTKEMPRQQFENKNEVLPPIQQHGLKPSDQEKVLATSKLLSPGVEALIQESLSDEEDGDQLEQTGTTVLLGDFDNIEQAVDKQGVQRREQIVKQILLLREQKNNAEQGSDAAGVSSIEKQIQSLQEQLSSSLDETQVF